VSITPRQFWVGVVSREHVHRGVEGGFIQLSHGEESTAAAHACRRWSRHTRRERRIRAASRCSTSLPSVIATGQIHQVEMSEDFKPYRVDVSFFKSTEVPIKPLVDRLSFIKNKTHWGAAFRFGYIKVPAPDFALIAEEMGVKQEVE
jgi:hypothetical protein